MKKLPIGIQTFSSIIQGNFVYIDKTPGIARMLDGAGRYFLSRPCRFGKSLLLDTIKSVFEGRQELFTGLYIEDKWDWSQIWPVIKIDFASGIIHSRHELNAWLHQQLDEQESRLGLKLERDDNPAIRFSRLIQSAANQSAQNQVVVLIDEYDKPILDNIDQTELASEVREGLKNLYSVMKAQDSLIRFIFMTGATKFSKVSLFSGINQIQDITLNKYFSDICGYTQNDLETTFAEHLAGVDMAELKSWYNGYHFTGEAVYNPYDILLFIFEDHTYRNYWFETGSPEFLIRLFKKHQYFLPDLENIEVGAEILNSFEVENINPITLLFQAGYLTIAKTYTDDLGEQAFVLEVPNREVKSALATQLIKGYAEQDQESKTIRQRLFRSLSQGNLAQLKQEIISLFAGIPWRNFTNNDLPDSEGYYASVLYAFFSSLNATIIPEDISNRGQADMTIQLGDYIYALEIKRDNSDNYSSQTPAQTSAQIQEQAQRPNPALTQIQQRGYSEKYLASGKQIFEVGMVFNSQQRQLVQMDWQQVR
ncbi:ATP-binding protein [Oceanospirillum beijerinckii]|uniref:ATP-binding protein n=1 Tax=Oceanospirillum beijerinckii TaxID=64976 RepID=UPI000424602C|nr:ATP-binding protein [Oceanospirillum beijerinckii]